MDKIISQVMDGFVIATLLSMMLCGYPGNVKYPSWGSKSVWIKTVICTVIVLLFATLIWKQFNQYIAALSMIFFAAVTIPAMSYFKRKHQS